MLHSKTTTNDFNFPVAFRPFPHKGLADEYRANGFFSNHGPAASLGFPQMRQTVSWRPQNTAIHLHGPVSKYGICSMNVPREFARHRSMPARQPVKTLSYGHSIPHLTKHISRRQRKSRLANLRRLRSNSYLHCQRPLCQGRFRHQSSSRSVRSRLNNDRFMPVSISLGTVSQNQRCHQASYLTQLTRQYSRVYPYFRRKTARRQCSRHFNCSAWLLLFDGSRLCGFRPTLYIQQASAFFVTRGKRNFQFKRRYSHPVDKSTGLRCDQTIITTGIDTAKDYPIPLRRIRYYDTDTGKNLIFITNNFDLPALIIARLYKARWQVELFFKWIKQHLRIKAFYGTSANAVKTQVWIAVSVYLLVAILKKRLNLDQSLYTILQFLSVSIFEKTPISEAFSQEFYKTKTSDYDNQLLLFNL